MSTLNERLKAIRLAETSGRAEFAEKTGIKKRAIEAYEQTGRSPRAEVIEAVAKTWPQYAYWLITGMTDPAHGHICPQLETTRRDSNEAGKAG